MQRPGVDDSKAAQLVPHQAPPILPAIEWVDLKLTDDQLKSRLGQMEVSEVLEVELSSNQLSAAGLDHLFSAGIAQIQRLGLYDNPLGDAGAARIAREGSALRFLHSLDLSYTQLSLEGLRQLLADGSQLPALQNLSLSGNALGDEGLKLLLESKHAQSLRSLALDKTGLSEAAIKLLAEAPLKLKDLNLSGNDLPAETRRALRAAPWGRGCRVRL